nr:reverse transcriptase domain-containing protein [Tanacetum cinerariifolium]
MGFKYKCFLDAYKGYHQIQMTKKDEEKTTFHTDEGIFCYTKTPFGLKNARETYQRLIDTIFEGQMGRNLEAYVDDMVIKSKIEPKMIKDIEETLLILKRASRKHLYLNPIRDSIFQSISGRGIGYLCGVSYPSNYFGLKSFCHFLFFYFYFVWSYASFPLHPRLYVGVRLEFMFYNEAGNSGHVCRSPSESIGSLLCLSALDFLAQPMLIVLLESGVRKMTPSSRVRPYAFSILLHSLRVFP